MSRVYNRVVKVGPRLSWYRWRPRLHRYEATFYNSAYGMGTVTALTARKCSERFDRMCGEFFMGY